jgi:hypothetical protein
LRQSYQGLRDRNLGMRILNCTKSALLMIAAVIGAVVAKRVPMISRRSPRLVGSGRGSESSLVERRVSFFCDDMPKIVAILFAIQIYDRCEPIGPDLVTQARR